MHCGERAYKITNNTLLWLIMFEENSVDHQEDKPAHGGRRSTDISALKLQLVRLKEDLGRFAARAPDGTVAGSLRERIRQVESEIAHAAHERRRAATEPPAETATRAAFQAIGGRFPPRRR